MSSSGALPWPTIKTIRLAELPPHITKTRAAKTSLSSLQEITAEAEKNHIIRIVQLTKGNRSKAAEILGISRKTLWEKIKPTVLTFSVALPLIYLPESTSLRVLLSQGELTGTPCNHHAYPG